MLEDQSSDFRLALSENQFSRSDGCRDPNCATRRVETRSLHDSVGRTKEQSKDCAEHRNRNYPVGIPRYNFVTRSRGSATTYTRPASLAPRSVSGGTGSAARRNPM